MAASAPASNYQIADTDELEALGRDTDPLPTYDTSAALSPEDPLPSPETASSSKRRCCVCAVFLALSIAAAVTFIAVLFTARTPRQEQPTQQQQPDSTSPQTSTVKTFRVTVVEKTPHDPKAFIQGFEYARGTFFESTGLRGRSTLRIVDPPSGNPIHRVKLPDNRLFGEGLTLHGTEHIFMLTWTSGRGFIFNQTSLSIIREFKYDGEGWGLATDTRKDEIYMSDGTSTLRVLDPDTTTVKRRVHVTLRGEAVHNLNELEWICGEVWANVWQTKLIYRIDPSSGVVKSIINADNLPLKADFTPDMDVLNGIAFDAETGRLWLTGKLWSKVYRVTMNDPDLDLTKCK